MADTGWLQGTDTWSLYEFSPSYETAWTNPSRAETENSSYATSSVLGYTSRYLYSTENLIIANFSAGVPTGATIDGIEVRIKARVSVNGSNLDAIRVEDKAYDAIDTGVGNSATASTGTLTTTNTFYTLGSPTEDWKSGGYTAAEVNHADFGVCVATDNNTGGTKRYEVDVIEVKIYYTEAGGVTHEGAVAATIDVVCAPDAFVVDTKGELSVTVETTATISGTLVDGQPQYELNDWAFMPYTSLEQEAFSATAGTYPSLSLLNKFLFRVSISEINATTYAANTSQFKIEARVNDGAWTADLTTLGMSAPAITDLQGVSNQWLSTERLTTGETFFGALGDDGIGSIDVDVAMSSNTTEVYWSILLTPPLDTGDDVDFRVLAYSYKNAVYEEIDHVTYPNFTLAAPIAKNIEQAAFRVRNDDGSETGATWLAALNTNASIPLDTTKRIRFQVEQDAATRAPNHADSILHLQFRDPTQTNYDQAEKITDGPSTGITRMHGSTIAVSGNGDVIVVGCPDEFSTNQYDDIIKTYRWNATTEVYDFAEQVSLNDLSYSNYGRWAGYVVEINYAGDKIFFSNSHFEFYSGHTARVHRIDWGGSSWTLHSTITYSQNSLAMSRYYFGVNIRTNVAGDVVIISDGTKVARYTVSGTTWTGTNITTLGITDSPGLIWNCTPDLGLFITTLGYCWTWGGSAYTKDSNHLNYADPFYNSRVCINTAVDHMVQVKTDSSSDAFNFMESRLLHVYDLSGTKGRTLVDLIPWELPDDDDNYGYFASIQMNRYDMTDDHDTLVCCSQYSNDGYRHDGSNDIFVYRRVTGGWKPVNLDVATTTSLVDPAKIVIPMRSSFVENDAGTTQQLGGGGTFVTTRYNELGLCRVRWPSSGTAITEVEFAFQLSSDFMSATDTIDVRVAEHHENLIDGRECTTYTNECTLTAIATPSATFVEMFRGRDDDGSESTASWKELAGHTFSPTPDEPFRIRYLVSEGLETAAATYKLEYVEDDDTNTPIIFNRVLGERGDDLGISNADMNLRTRLVGDPLYDSGAGTDNGGVYLQHWDDATRDWTNSTGTYLTLDEVSGQRFGSDVVMSGNGEWALVEASGTNGVNFGKVSFVKIVGTTISNWGVPYQHEPDDNWLDTMSISESGNRAVILITTAENHVVTLRPPSIVGGSPIVNIIETSRAYNDMALSGSGKVLALSSVVDDVVEFFDWSSEAQNWKSREEVSIHDMFPGKFYYLDNIALDYKGNTLFATGKGQYYWGQSWQGAQQIKGGGTGCVAKNIAGTWTFNNSFEGGGTCSYTSDAAFMYVSDKHGSGLYERQFNWKEVEDIGHGSSPVVFDNSTHITDGEVTTQQLGSGTFVAGDMAESQWPSTTWTATTGEETEHEFVIENIEARLDLYKSIRYRLVDNSGNRIPGNFFLKTYPEVIMPALEQEVFRAREDNGTEITATWYASLNTDWSEIVENTRRIRFALNNSASVSLDHDRTYKLQYNKNGTGDPYHIPVGIYEPVQWYDGHAAISGDGLVAVVGNSQYRETGEVYGGGGVFVFDNTGPDEWTQRGSVIRPSPLQTDGNFGFGLALNSDGSVLYVGEPGYTGTYTAQGRVHRYTWGGSSWSLDTTIEADWLHVGHGPAANENFGKGVTISDADDVLVIGAPGYVYSGNTNAGAAYMFKKTASVWDDNGLVTVAVTNLYMGWSVALSNNGVELAVGAPGYTSNAGTVYLLSYSGGSWGYRAANIPAVAVDEKLGYCVAMDYNGRTIYVGAPYLGATGSVDKPSGVHVYDYDGLDTVNSITYRSGTLDVSDLVGTLGETIAIDGHNQVGLTGDQLNIYNFGIDYDWTDVGARAAIDKPVRMKATANLTDKEATTQQLTSGTFDAGEAATLDNASTTWTAVSDTEIEYSVEFYDTGDYSTGDQYMFRVIDLDDDQWDEMVYVDYPTATIYSDLPLTGEVEATVDTVVTAFASVIRLGAVSATVDVSTNIVGGTQTDYFGEVDLTVDTVVDLVGEVILAPKDGEVDLRVRTWLDTEGHVALRGEVDLHFGTRLFATPSLILAGEVDAVVEVTTLLASDNYVLGNINCIVDTTLDLLGGVVHHSEVDLLSDCSVTLNANKIYAGDLNLVAESFLYAGGGLTFDAKCVIIIDSTVDATASVDRNASLVSSAEVSTLIEGHVTKNASMSISADVAVNALAYSELVGRVVSLVQCDVRADGDIVAPTPPCYATSTIVQTDNVTTVTKSDDHTSLSFCATTE